MNDLTPILLEIERKYSKLNDTSKKELVSVIKNINGCLSSQDGVKKLHAIKIFIQKFAQKKESSQLRISGNNFSTLQKLRNNIAHNQNINNRDLLSFANFIWKEIPILYSGDQNSLYNILSYAIRPTIDIPKHFSSTKDLVAVFREIYDSRDEIEKIDIVKTLIPLVVTAYKQNQIVLNKLDEMIALCDKILDNPNLIEKGERKDLSDRIAKFLETSKLMTKTEYIEEVNKNLPADFWMTHEDYIRKTKNMRNILIAIKDKVELSGIDHGR